ncbi:hypothetical protein TNCV_1344701 [Trichonephila clavipes]|nr:hypothetical protein TNCV_1344701 [Trichonephila clavipes]
MLTANGHLFTVQSRIGLSYHRPLIWGVPPMTQNPYLTTRRAIYARTHVEGPLSDFVLPHTHIVAVADRTSGIVERDRKVKPPTWALKL